MIFHRLNVAHFKGIRIAEIRFAPSGITLLQGRNEIGKSSLVQAIITLFDEPSTRRRSTIEHLIPKDGSGTPEISLEAESGKYRFVFSKSFVENKSTRLTLLEPYQETLEGGAAQDYFEKILNETLDRTLWRALMLQQGNAVGLPEVDGQQALMSALDSAVAGPGGTPDFEGLYGRVAEEFGKYYQARHGGELKILSTLRDDVAKAHADVAMIEDRLRDMEGKIARSRRLREDIHGLRDGGMILRRRIDEAERRLQEVERLVKARDAECARRDRAREIRLQVERESKSRKSLADEVENARARLSKAESAVASADSLTGDSDRIALEKKAILDRLDTECRRYESLVALRRADYEYYRDKRELEELRKAMHRLQESLPRLSGAEKELARNKVTEKAAREIREAENALVIARAIQEGAAPKVRLEALDHCEIVIDDNNETLNIGESRSVPVTGLTNLLLPGRLRIEISPGDGVHGPERQVEKADMVLREILDSFGVSDAAEVPSMIERRREAERVVEEHTRVREEVLGDFDGDTHGLAERIRVLETAVSGYLEVRDCAPPIASDAESARSERESAERILEDAAMALVEAQTAYSAVDSARQEAGSVLVRLRAELEMATRDMERLESLLAESRERALDRELEKALEKAERDFSDASAAVAVIEAELVEKGAETIRGQIDGLRDALVRSEREAASVREELARLEGELELLGGNGMRERLEELETVLEYKTRLLNAELRKAEAARLLYEIVSEARERSQKAYVLPLKARIEDLARSVYGRDVSVTLDKGLLISRRIMDGMDIGFGELSGGAREQFSLIHRAACSLVVAKDGGVPLILDDALGYSDAERLIGMNEVLSRAAQRCQIILLTCMPNRYAYLEPTVRVNLEDILK